MAHVACSSSFDSPSNLFAYAYFQNSHLGNEMLSFSFMLWSGGQMGYKIAMPSFLVATFKSQWQVQFLCLIVFIVG